jgi:hypothetical protein
LGRRWRRPEWLGPERPVAIGAGGEVEGVVVAVDVDVLVGERRDVLEFAGGDQLAAGAQLVEDAAGVDGVPGDDRVDDDRQAERLLALLVRRALADVPFVGVEDGAAEGVELLLLSWRPIRCRSSSSASQASTKLVFTSRPYSCRAWASG